MSGIIAVVTLQGSLNLNSDEQKNSLPLKCTYMSVFMAFTESKRVNLITLNKSYYFHTHTGSDMVIFSVKILFYVSEIIIFITGHRVQFDVTYVMEILPISTTI